MSSDSNIRVAVRVRPPAEKDPKNMKPTVKMDPKKKTTTITSPEGEKSTFTFDHSYWSYDGSEMDEEGRIVGKNGSDFAAQQDVFRDLGTFLLDNAYNNFNSTLLAYGQTNSGKTYSTFGNQTNPGIIPLLVEGLFKRVADETTEKRTFRVAFAMMEVYREKLKDLLVEKQPKGKDKLAVWHSSSYGYYVRNLSEQPAASKEEILTWMKKGATKRTIAETEQNKRSSRAHTIYTLKLTTIEKDELKDEDGKLLPREVSCKMNIVDLAGSERVGQSWGNVAEERSREGLDINMSLMWLRRVIHGLVEKAQSKQTKGKGKGKSKGPPIGFGQSVLTKILKDSLGGNSRTVMLAAISAAPGNYIETMSTLKFADSVKMIKTKPVANIDPREVLLKELEAEKKALEEELEKWRKGQMAPTKSVSMEGENDESRERLEAEVQEKINENQELMARLAESQEHYQQRLAAAQQELNQSREKEEQEEREKSTMPHFVNLNEDPSLSRMLRVLLPAGKTLIGHRPGNERNFEVDQSLVISGAGIENSHAVIHSENGVTTIKSCGDATTCVSGKEIGEEEVELHHNDFVVFGGSAVYAVVVPLEVQKLGSKALPDITWFAVQEALARAKGLNQTEKNSLLNEALVELFPLVSEANMLSVRMDRRVQFSARTQAKISASPTGGRSVEGEVVVDVERLDDDISYTWSATKFLDRVFEMRDLFERYEDGEVNMDTLDLEQDPFWDSHNDQLIGHAVLYLNSLRFCMELDVGDMGVPIAGQAPGVHLNVGLAPVMEDGSTLDDEDLLIEDPDNMLDRPLHLLLSIEGAKGLPREYKTGATWCQYRFYGDEEDHHTKLAENTTNPCFDYSRVIHFESVSPGLLKHFESSILIIEVWGRKGVAKPKTLKRGLGHAMSTRDLRAARKEAARMASQSMHPEDTMEAQERMKQHHKVEVDRLQVRIEDLEDRYADVSNRLMDAVALLSHIQSIAESDDDDRQRWAELRILFAAESPAIPRSLATLKGTPRGSLASAAGPRSSISSVPGRLLHRGSSYFAPMPSLDG